MSFLIDFTNMESSNILYGGNAGLKKGIKYDNSNWLLKFPQETSTFDKVDISFTTSPLSEYIGSHIYKLLGYNVHNTLLGYYYNDKIERKQIVVACEDFTNDGNLQLVDYEVIKNNYSDDLQVELSELNAILPKYKSSTLSQHSIRIEEIILQFKKNSIFVNNPKSVELFWEMLVIDYLINNNDRNKNNWGFLYNKDTSDYKIAPIYDNGASFVSKHTDEKLLGIMETEAKMNNSVLNGMSYYTIDNELTNFVNLFKKLISRNKADALLIAIKKVISLVDLKWNEIESFINNMPEEENGLKIISKVQKQFFIKSIAVRDKYLLTIL